MTGEETQLYGGTAVQQYSGAAAGRPRVFLVKEKRCRMQQPASFGGLRSRLVGWIEKAWTRWDVEGRQGSVLVEPGPRAHSTKN